MRESVSRAISTKTIDPSGMATGPSGNCKPDATISMVVSKNDPGSRRFRCREPLKEIVAQ
jgi:hypothetical protein